MSWAGASDRKDCSCSCGQIWALLIKVGKRKRPGAQSEAEILGWEAFERQKKALGFTHPDTLRSMNDLAVFLNEVRIKYDEAEGALPRSA